MHVQFLVTGELEDETLGEAILRAIGEIDDCTLMPTLRTDSMTSSGRPLTDEGNTSIRRFANRLVSEFAPGRGSRPPDVLVAIDDLEPWNTAQPDLVVKLLRRALRERLDRIPQTDRARTASLLQRRTSFHLLAPMPETYFFGDPAALSECMLHVDRVPRLLRDDLEDFETDDPSYLSVARRETWDARHPKRYLQFLSDGNYHETSQGKAALRRLSWRGLSPKHDPLGFARAMFEDIVFALFAGLEKGFSNPLGSVGPKASATFGRGIPESRNPASAADVILRNI
mgnify:CR=1 FL=1